MKFQTEMTFKGAGFDGNFSASINLMQMGYFKQLTRDPLGYIKPSVEQRFMHCCFN